MSRAQDNKKARHAVIVLGEPCGLRHGYVSQYTGFARYLSQNRRFCNMPRSSKDLKLSHAVAQPRNETRDIPFKTLLNESYKFIIKPKFQRELTWTLRMKQQYIDSIFLGDPIASVEAYEGLFKEGEHIGEDKYEIADGQNRVLTLLEFMNDEFKTMTVRQKLSYEPNSTFEPVEPGKFFSEINQITRNYWFKHYLHIEILRERSESEKATRFLRVENHVPLSAAEKLRVYTSKAKEATSRIEQHPFWEDFYEGKKSRGQVFQSSLYLLALEMAPNGIVDLQSGGYTQGLIFGNHDDKITDALVDAVLARLDVVSHLYHGTAFTRRVAAIAMYQSVMFIERDGYVIQSTDKGCLSKWMDSILEETRRVSGVPNYAKPIQSLTSAKGQQDFWYKYLDRVKALVGSHRQMRQDYERITSTAGLL